MPMILVDPHFRDVPVGIVLLLFPQRDPQRFRHTLAKDLAAESGHPHHVVLRFVHRVGGLVQFHASQSPGSRGTLLTPLPLQAGTSRWIRQLYTIHLGEYPRFRGAEAEETLTLKVSRVRLRARSHENHWFANWADPFRSCCCRAGSCISN